MITEIEKWMKEPRPADLESSLTVACDYIKILIKRIKELEDADA